MSKQPVSWLELTSIVRKDLPKGSAFGEASKRAKPIWKEIVAGTHPKYSKKDTSGSTRKKKKGKADGKAHGKTKKHKKSRSSRTEVLESSLEGDGDSDGNTLKAKLMKVTADLDKIIKSL